VEKLEPLLQIQNTFQYIAALPSVKAGISQKRDHTLEHLSLQSQSCVSSRQLLSCSPSCSPTARTASPSQLGTCQRGAPCRAPHKYTRTQGGFGGFLSLSFFFFYHMQCWTSPIWTIWETADYLLKPAFKTCFPFLYSNEVGLNTAETSYYIRHREF